VNYKEYIQAPQWYDLIGADNLAMLSHYGLRSHHSLLDVGCGCLRVGRFLLSYLDTGNYYGIDPNGWLISSAVMGEGLWSLVDMKHPNFAHNDDFDLTVFNRKFDFMLSTSVLCHASQNQIRACLKSAARALEPHGAFFVSLNLHPTDQYSKDEWSWPRAINHTIEFIDDAIKEAGLECSFIDWRDTLGQEWLILMKDREAYIKMALENLPNKRVIWGER
jgi:SAM-dependent methyltransferase